MADNPATLEVVLLSSAIGGAVSFLGAFIKSRLDSSAKVDELLRGKRTEQYLILWEKTRVVPKWPRDDTLTYADITELSKALRAWYFDGGGIYLSRSSQKTYARLQDTIWSILDQKPGGEVVSNHYDLIQKRCSALRTSMTDDVSSRRRAPHF